MRQGVAMRRMVVMEMVAEVVRFVVYVVVGVRGVLMANGRAC